MKIGDLVAHKYLPNTPVMQVTWVDLETAVCQWFDKNQAPHSCVFPRAYLMAVTSG